MPIILRLACSTDGCKSGVDGEEEIDLSDLNGDHSKLWYGQRLEAELYVAANHAGWHWDGREWRCPACMAPADVETVGHALGV